VEKQFRVVVLLGKSEGVQSANLETLALCEEFVLFLMEKHEVLQYKILDKTTNTIIQDQKGDVK